MYTTHFIKDKNILEVKNTSASVLAKIHLNAGASLQELTLNNHAIIQDLSPLAYDVTYASSILFPFANRIKDGVYKFDGTSFQLEKNQEEEQNALHGFVYKKKFSVTAKELNDDYAKISLLYEENETSKGFPFTYNMHLEYTFSEKSVSLKVIVENTSKTKFPYTLGWHPYFISDNLKESVLMFDSTKKIVLDNRNITTGTKTIANDSLSLNTPALDDCWILNSDEVQFKTPKYQLTFNTTGNNNFLQAYMPPKPNAIAIEPTTGVSDSFNNGIGLKTLAPNEIFEITWKITIN